MKSSNRLINLTRLLAAISLPIMSAHLPAAGCAGAKILGVFHAGDFVPHIATLWEAKRELKGMTPLPESIGGGLSYRVEQGHWLILKVAEAADERFAGVEAVVYTSLPPLASSLEQPRGEPLVGLGLGGVRLGDRVKHLRSVWPSHKEGAAALLGRQVATYEVTPREGEDDLYFRYYVQSGLVVALEIGVTE